MFVDNNFRASYSGDMHVNSKDIGSPTPLSPTTTLTGYSPGGTILGVPPYSSPVIVAPGSGRRSRKQNTQIVNQLFAYCSELCADSYWSAILMESAYGRLPKRFSFQNGILSHRKGGKEVSRTLSENPSEALPSIISFFRAHENLSSEEDKMTSYMMASQCVGDGAVLDRMCWDNYNSSTKDTLINDYITHMTKIHSLTQSEVADLFCKITGAVFLGLLTGKEIIVECRAISCIYGLNMNGTEIGKRTFTLNPCLVPTKIPVKQKEVLTDLSARSNAKDMIPGFHKKWSKYMARQTTKQLQFNRIMGKQYANMPQVYDILLYVEDNTNSVTNEYSMTGTLDNVTRGYGVQATQGTTQQNYQHQYQQNYQQSAYQENYQHGFQQSYQPGYQQGYQQSIQQPMYQENYQQASYAFTF